MYGGYCQELNLGKYATHRSTINMNALKCQSSAQCIGTLKYLLCSCHCQVCSLVSLALVLDLHFVLLCLCKVCSLVGTLKYLLCSCHGQVCSLVSLALMLDLHFVLLCLCKVCSLVGTLKYLLCSCHCQVCSLVSLAIVLDLHFVLLCLCKVCSLVSDAVLATFNTHMAWASNFLFALKDIITRPALLVQQLSHIRCGIIFSETLLSIQIEYT